MTIPYDIDPSLHGSAPEPEELEDGFSPRDGAASVKDREHVEHPGQPPEAVLTDKSPY
jgi:hypothetical protein